MGNYTASFFSSIPGYAGLLFYQRIEYNSDLLLKKIKIIASKYGLLK